MFRTLFRKLGINALDQMLNQCAREGGRSILLGWNRGLGDIALGLYAIVHRIREKIPNAEITFVTRDNLLDGFSMLGGCRAIGASHWKRGERYDLKEMDLSNYDLVIEYPSPTDWCTWQHKTLTPRLKWDLKHDSLYRKFDLPDGFTYIGVQVSAETDYGLWRNWPLAKWTELFDRLEQMGGVRVLLFGFGKEPEFSHRNLIDLRGKTNLFELLSIIKHRCDAVVLPDSGISSMIYYLDETFPLRQVTLWADSNHGILKQGVGSPNRQLIHRPLIGENRDLSTVTVDQVLDAIFPKRKFLPLSQCVAVDALPNGPVDKSACVILAGGQGSRLGFKGPKGLFVVDGKTLFQHVCEKVPSSMPIVVMTSPLNRKETEEYFQTQGNFGREVLFFEQTVLPLLDDRYEPVSNGPDGNGSLFEGLIGSGILAELEKKGVDTLLIVPVDNPLADPADAPLIEYHRSRGNEVTIKCIERRPGESMGVLVEQEGKVGIAEYIDLTKEQLASPQFQYAYTGQVALSLPFIKRAASFELPLHWVRKANLWKRERFIFDAFKVGKRVEAVCYPRERCYAPIKGKS